MTYRAAIVFKEGVTRFIEVRPNEKLLDAALRFGISLPMDCREGVCSTCRGQCESGSVEMEYVDEDALSETEIAAGAILACQSRLKADSSFYFDIDAAVCSIKPQRYQATVVEVQQISQAAASLTLQLDEGQPPLHYLPGQYARLSIPDTDQHRAYSYANAVNPEGTVRFLIRLLPSGVMSDYLRQRAKAGDKIEQEGPLGAFY
ncbi:MAG: FAD-binding oxidoreductase, partial [Enterobacteriaceae bacterium]